MSGQLQHAEHFWQADALLLSPSANKALEPIVHPLGTAQVLQVNQAPGTAIS